jgi:phage/plasmid-like protein (TIGR03299 family)
MQLAGHNFKVDLMPVHFQRPAGKGDHVEVVVPNQRAVVRTDRWQALGVVGKKYHTLQNAEAFAILEPLLDADLVQLETGGTLRGGADVWMQVRLNIDHPTVQRVQEELGARPLVFIYNNHVGAKQLTVKEAWERIVCANTLEVALGQQGQRALIRHTASIKERLVDAARQMFATLVEHHVDVARQFDYLKGRAVDDALFAKLVLDVIAPLPELGEKPTARQEGSLERAEARRVRLIKLRAEGDGHTGDGSAWEAYNAVTQSLDHDVDLWRVRGGEGRTASASFGQIAQMKVLVLKGLLSGKPQKVLVPRG